IILEIDKSLNVCETTAEVLSKKKTLQEFLKSHCRIRHYSFQIIFHQNATNTDCYEGFKTVYNTKTSEKYRPTPKFMILSMWKILMSL
ncbi:hypothetical protein RhiirC2_798239, partial [Rhizophagus irregularis]